MSDKNGTDAMIWNLEHNFIAVSESLLQAATLSADDSAHCLGSGMYGIGTRGFAIEQRKDLCIASLLFQDSMAVIQNCETILYKLPTRGKMVD